MPENQGLGEQALNKAAEIGISSQLDQVENLDVNVKTDPLNLLQGQVEMVKIEGEGLVMQQSLRVEELQMQINNVAINPLSAAFGKIELTKPAQGQIRVVLTESDINNAFNSDYIRDKLQSQQINFNGESVKVLFEWIKFHLPGNNHVNLNASLRLNGSSKLPENEIQKIAFSAVPVVSSNGRKINLEKVEYGEVGEISPHLTEALVNTTSDILDLNNFDLEGMDFKVNHLNAEVGKLIISAQAYVEQIASMQ